MGCAHSGRPSLNSSSRGLEARKMESGYTKGTYRKSTGARHLNGKMEFRKESMEERERKSSISSNGSERGKADAGEVVDGWPRWLVDNIPREALKDIVPKSADSYVKIEKIGQGTYSNVYKARDKETGKVVALKKVRFDTSEPESVKFMAREITILQKLDHPNIVKLQGLATSRMQYSLYLVFEYMPYDLSRILSRPDDDDNSLTEPQIKCYMQQLLSGLQHCHERGILHRDIKASNLLIDKNGVLKIADLGLANFFNLEKRCPQTSLVVTLWYRAPELLLGSTDYGIGIDLWSVGCLMAEMFAGRSEVEQVHKIFKLCGTPCDDYYKRLNLSTTLKPSQTYESNLGEMLKNFPSSAFGLMTTLLSLDPTHRGSATSALQNEFFQTSPLACEISELPVIHVEDIQDEVPMQRHRTNSVGRRQRERRKKKVDAVKPKEDDEVNNSSEKSIFDSLTGSSTTSTPSLSVNPPRLYPSPVHEMSSTTEAHPNATKDIKNRSVIHQNKDVDDINRFDLVERSASSREIKSEVG